MRQSQPHRLRSNARPALAATNGARYDAELRRPLCDALTCLRFKRKLDGAGRLLNPNAERHLKHPREMGGLFSDLLEAVAGVAELGLRLGFTLEDLAYEFPCHPRPAGDSAASYVRKEILRGAAYG